MKKLWAYRIIIFLMIPYLHLYGYPPQLSNQNNYVMVASPVDRVRYSESNVNASNSFFTINYFDGLGRLIQEVKHQVSSGSDLANFIEYNSRGKASKKWLPTIAGTDGNFVNRAQVSASCESLYEDQQAYSSMQYDNSIDNYLKEVKVPGTPWHASVGKTTYKTLNREAGDYSCDMYLVDYSSENLKKNGSHPASTLEVIETTDEDGYGKIEFRDCNNNVVLLRKINKKLNKILDTYFVYDLFGNLRYVIPPIASIAFSNIKEKVINDNDEILNKYCYTYSYDKNNLCISKKIPGSDAYFMVYDSNYRLVRSQDGNQRKNNEWIYYLYDKMGHLAVTGITTDSTTHTDLINSLGKIQETTSFNATDTINSAYGYSNQVKGWDRNKILSVNYYDNYNFLKIMGEGSNQFNYIPLEGYGSKDSIPLNNNGAKGLLSGSLNFTLNAGIPHRMLTVNYYDSYGRPCQVVGNDIDGRCQREAFAYRFSGKVLKHYICRDSEPAQVYEYCYNIMDQITNITHSIGGKSPHTLVANTYDAIGRVETSKYGDIYDMGFNYNIHNWLTSIDGSVFTQTLCYEKGSDGAMGYLNGNVREMAWSFNNSNTFTVDEYAGSFKYDYDGANRLLKACYNESKRIKHPKPIPGLNIVRPPLVAINPDYSTYYTYDANGNMTGINRRGLVSIDKIIKNIIRCITYNYGVVDSLGLKYDGNKLKKVTDFADDVALEGSMDFKDGIDRADEYLYDANGNMTKDLNKGITSISYNILNLPQRIVFADGHFTDYTYDISGRKLREEYKIDHFHVVELPIKGVVDIVDPSMRGTKGLNGFPVIPVNPTLPDLPFVPRIETELCRDYCSSYIYEDGKLARILTDNGYYADSLYHFYINDYQGNIRTVIAEDGTVGESNSYYPYGMLFGESSSVSSQPYKYGGKELDTMNGLNQYDFGARRQDPALGLWTTGDPLCELKPSISPYSYCLGNPIKYIDPSGLFESYFDAQVYSLNNNGGTPYQDRKTGEWFLAMDAMGTGPYQSGGIVTRDFGPKVNDDMTPLLTAAGAYTSYSQYTQYSNTFNIWKGQNGKIYRGLKGRGPNKFTGSRAAAKVKANRIGWASNILTVFSIGISHINYRAELSKNPGPNLRQYLHNKQISDQILNGSGFAGPYGAAASFGYGLGGIIESITGCSIQINPYTLDFTPIEETLTEYDNVGIYLYNE